MPEPPSFPETITLVRDRVRKIIGRKEFKRSAERLVGTAIQNTEQ
jgi:hypothetical protein